MEKLFEQLDFTYENELFKKRNNVQEDCVHFEVYGDQEELFVDLLAQVEAYFAGYIWNFSPLQLRQRQDHVEGVLQFGDLYEESWLLVAFLIDYSRKRDTVKCRIFDADGEFLLIEGADHVPAWLEPGKDEKKVWFYRGRLCLGDVDKLAVAPTPLESAIMARAREKSSSSLLHTSRVLLSQKAASILRVKPQLIAPIIQTFYTRDPGDMKHLTLMKHFPRAPEVNCSVKFNKCHFAQLLSQPFNAHRKSGYLPAPLKDHPDYLAYSIGAKLAAGLEILVNEGGKGAIDQIDEALFDDFVGKLTQRDYFEGNITGSARHNELLARARQFYRDTHDNEQSNESYRRQSAQVIAQLYENVKFSGGSSEIIDESLEWLNLDEGEFVSGLETKYEWKNEQNQVADKMKQFVSKESDLLNGVDNEDLTSGLRLDPAKFGACIDRLCGQRAENKDSDDEEESDYLDSDDLDSDTEQYYGQMAAELDGEKVMAGLVKSEDVVDDIKDESLSIDLNLVSGMLKSLESQMGLSGPAGNVMKSIGLDLPE